MGELATKEDLKYFEGSLLREINTQTRRLVTFVCGFGTALAAAVFFIARNVH